MAQASSPSDRLILRDGDLCQMVGRSGAGAMPVFVVLHRARGDEPDWTHAYRLDARCPRTVHLERALPGDRRAELRRWVEDRFGLSAGSPQDFRLAA